MLNPYKQFIDLLPKRPLLVGTVQAIASGVATIELPGGATIRARGEAAAGDHVFVRDGVIEGPAPILAVVPIDI